MEHLGTHSNKRGFCGKELMRSCGEELFCVVIVQQRRNVLKDFSVKRKRRFLAEAVVLALTLLAVTLHE